MDVKDIMEPASLAETAEQLESKRIRFIASPCKCPLRRSSGCLCGSFEGKLIGVDTGDPTGDMYSSSSSRFSNEEKSTPETDRSSNVPLPIISPCKTDVL